MKRYVWWGLIALALYFAVQGGEYSSWDLLQLQRREHTLTRRVDSLQHHVDSLGHFLGMVKSDSATMERIAREEFGMVRGDKEILYRFGESPDNGNRK
jgi:cell division protein FtsB